MSVNVRRRRQIELDFEEPQNTAKISWFSRFGSACINFWKVPGSVDPAMAALVIALVGFGVVMVFSASAIEATVRYHDPYYFVKKQGAYAVLGLGLTWIVSRIDYHRYRKLTYPILIVVVGLLIACIVGLGHKGGGATRWIAMGPINMQPAELSKMSLVLWLAYSLAKKGEGVKGFSVGFLPHLIMSGFLMLLCLKQPDFGSAVVLLLLTFTLLFVAGAKVGYILGAGLLGSVVGFCFVRFREYAWKRVLAWQDMEARRQDLAYQPFQARLAFGSGQWHGLGLGKGLQVLYLPEAHTDFIGAVIGEELGFIGIFVLCCVYAFLILRGVKAAFRAPDDYGTYMAFGLSALIALQVLINLAVAMSLLPTKGLTLPFLSYGGSSLLVNAMAVGILLNISRHGVEKSEAIDTTSTDKEFAEAR